MAGHPDPFDEAAKMVMESDGHAHLYGDPTPMGAPPMGRYPNYPPSYVQQQPQRGGPQGAAAQMQQQYAAARQHGYHPQQMMMPPQSMGHAPPPQQDTAHYRLTRQRSMQEPDPFLVASTSQGMPMQQYRPAMAPDQPGVGGQPQRGTPQQVMNEALATILKSKPLPTPENIERILLAYPFYGGVGGPSFQMLTEFYNAAPKYDIALCSLKLMGAHIQNDKSDVQRLERVQRVAREYVNGLEKLKTNGKEKQIKTLQEHTLKIMKEHVLGPDKFEKIQVAYTGYFLKLVLYEMHQSQRQRGSQTHMKCIALYVNFGFAIQKSTPAAHFKLQTQALKALLRLVGHQTLEYLWRRVIYIFIYHKDREKKARQRMQQQNYMAAQGSMYPPGGNPQGFYGQQQQQLPPGQQQSPQSEDGLSPSQKKGQAKGKKRRAGSDGDPAEQASSAAKKPKKVVRGKQTAAAKRKAAAERTAQLAAENNNGHALAAAQVFDHKPVRRGIKTYMDQYVESNDGIFTHAMKKRMVNESLKLFGLDIDAGALETLAEGVEIHLRSIMAKAKDVMSSRTIPFVKSGMVNLTNDPRKEVAAIYRREFAATKAKQNAEKAALLKEGEKKKSKKDMDDTTKEKLDKLIEEEDKKKLAKDANAATMAVLGGADAKWNKWGSGAKKSTPTKSAAGKSGTLLDKSSLLKRFAQSSGSVENRSITVDDILLVLRRDWRYKDSKWLMQLDQQ
ncbi:TAF4 domain-containing protein [Chloropicon primus]|uniref:Transcription initiation factor TFIID component TAF4 C-terminal domain-containing protein n=1 Tax=Chloropicon primus TaxID=1764295 RepID=A0A5B8MP40_9CHLO|nr:hypothetical protein A3770_07p46950 [Chloropicon primus]UPR01394.1 TAF4 domain-containing protein [Chloropicon primus]|mmetsp:Transcript_4156/g.12107  ORF Transcript_4156/g.12107 Transcript_4156/m.12107 type:complete len:729 (-) Transcript_4156:983-3169(-)|eukprot:QDZ22177.1 hypothetical protein A3770_07p46950 [Chloropicon primus]